LIRRLVVLPEHASEEIIENFRRFWIAEDGRPERVDVFTNMDIKIITIKPEPHEIWLRHQISWRVR